MTALRSRAKMEDNVVLPKTAVTNVNAALDGPVIIVKKQNARAQIRLANMDQRARIHRRATNVLVPSVEMVPTANLFYQCRVIV